MDFVEDHRFVAEAEHANEEVPRLQDGQVGLIHRTHPKGGEQTPFLGQEPGVSTHRALSALIYGRQPQPVHVL